ncbi:MAG: anthranilate phosphoribosyltransferase [Ignavibacteriales bacterium]|nr:anthranilate phosphoribosyltransferase [Ignavibacteriales bacterium]WKZ71672.1 MAG: anthranilate phosphoribosyltransferase [Ignavibacteriaceae bacterium]
MKQFIEKIIGREDLSVNEAHFVMDNIMSGAVNNSQLAALLIALKSKGETPAEIAGFAKAMREKSVKVANDTSNLIDVCGTGGDDSGTFNISTTAAFVVAGAGVKVAKHGNKSVSSRSGSADVLAELGVRIDLTPEQTVRAIEETGIGFLFAPHYHPAMKYAAVVRKELGLKTVFNLLGPLTNPAGTKKQLIGVYNNRSAKLLAEAAKYLEMERVCFICTGDRRDELTLDEPAVVYEYNAGKPLREFELLPGDFGFGKAEISALIGDTPEVNAAILYEILSSGERNDRFNVTVANSAMALYSAGVSDDLIVCKEMAEDSLLSGKALAKLTKLREISSRAA